MAITIRAVGYADHWGGTPDTWDVEDGDRYLGTIEVNPCDPQRYLPYLGSGEDLPAARTLTGAIDAITAADNNVHGGAS